MSSPPSQLFVRTEQGQIFGPIAPGKVSILLEKGMLQGRVEVSLDGVSYALPGEVESVRDLFPEALWTSSAAPRGAPVIPPPPPAAGAPMAGPGAIQNAARSTRVSNVQVPLRDTQPMARPAPAPTPAAPPPPPPPPPLAPEPTTGSGLVEHRLPVPPIPAQGDLAQTSVFKLLAMATASNATGLFRFLLSDRVVEVHFRKGGAESVSSAHPEDALGAFLLGQKVITADQLAQAEAAKSRFGEDVFGALMGLGFVNPGNVFGSLAQRAHQLMLKAVLAPSGTFSFEARELAAFKALPLGNKWNVLADLLRRIPSVELRRKLVEVFDLPVLKSNGWVEFSDLKLMPQEARALGFFDGVRPLARLVEEHKADADPILRLAYLLREVGGVSFVALAGRQRPVTGAPPKEAADSVPPPAPRTAPPAPVAVAPRPAAPPAAARPATVIPPPPAPPPAPAPAAAPTPPTESPAWLHPGSPPAAPATPARTTPAPVAPPPAPAKASPPSASPASSAAPAWLTSARRAAEPVVARTDASFQAELKDLRARAAKLKGETYFEVLGLSENADAASVKVAYFKLAKVFHPDTVPPEAPPEITKLKADIFSVISEAYRTLTDEKSRLNYIEELKYGGGDKIDVAQILMAEETFQKATLLVKARRFPEALKLLDEAIKANPDEGEFYAWRGFAKFFVNPDKEKANQEAHLDLHQAIKRNERCAPAHFFMGQIAKLSGQDAAALKHFKRTVELQPEHVDAQREIRILVAKK